MQHIIITHRPKKFLLTPGDEYLRVIKVEEINHMKASWSRTPNFYFSYYYFTGTGVRLDF